MASLVVLLKILVYIIQNIINMFKIFLIINNYGSTKNEIPQLLIQDFFKNLLQILIIQKRMIITYDNSPFQNFEKKD